MPYITEVYAKSILDSKGNPTIECEVFTESGAYGRASVSSMYDMSFDNKEIRDKGDTKYNGLGVNKTVSNINDIIEKSLVGEDVRDQAKIDNKLLKLDNTQNKSKLGTNAILAVSLAVARCASDYTGLSLHSYIGGAMSRNIPRPLITITSYKGIEVIVEVIKEIGILESFRIIKELCNKFEQYYDYPNSVDSSFNKEFNNLESVLHKLKKIIESYGLKHSKDINIILNMNADNFYDLKNKTYRVDGKEKTSLEMIEYYESLIKKYNISMFIDPYSKGDTDAYKKLTKRLGLRAKITGYNLYSSNRRKIEKGLDNQYTNAVVLNISEIGTLTETYDLVEVIKRKGASIILSESSTESEDSIISDIAVGLNIPMIKLSSLFSNGSTPKYNELIRINDSLDTTLK